MFRLKRSGIDTHSEHVIFLHEEESGTGAIGLKPLDRVKVEGRDEATGEYHSIQGVLNFCSDGIVDEGSLALSRSAFADLALPEGTSVRAKLAAPPESISRVRDKLAGGRLDRSDFDAILIDVTQRRYSKVELSMFVLACALRRLDMEELIDFTRAMISHGDRLDFGPGPIADKHCIGGIPGNRTTMVIVPIVASLGVTIPKTSSRAITSPAGTADTMGVLAEVRLGRERMYEVVRQVGGCIAWGGALDLAPADDVLITVERPMGIDTEAQMIASIMSKKKAAGASHALIDVPIGPTAKVRSRAEAASLGSRFEAVARAIGLDVEIMVTEVDGPIGTGVGPRLEALDVLAVLNGDPTAPGDLREKSLQLAARLLANVGTMGAAEARAAVDRALDSGAAAQKFDAIVAAQGRRQLPPPARFKGEVPAPRSGVLSAIDCQVVNTLAKLAGAPAHPAAGLRVLCKPGSTVERGEPLLEVHAQSPAHLEFAIEHAADRPDIFDFSE